MIVLGIETSCDETAVALVRDGREILSSVVASQIALHEPYGGIVPEIACRAHADWLLPLFDQALREAELTLDDVDVVAATARPGLIGALFVGLSAGKALAWSLGKPFVGVDHIEGHIHAVRMANPRMIFPHLTLVVSGGHTQIYRSDHACHKELVAGTSDDAAGECFDKVSALLGLGYPGGPRIEEAARRGDTQAIAFPRGKAGEDGLQLSFSGLKTSVLYHMQRCGYRIEAGRPKLELAAAGGPPVKVEDIAASFQEAVVDMLLRVALATVSATGIRTLGLTGGVAANSRLREKLAAACTKAGIDLSICPKALCTDNAAFIAGVAGAYAAAWRFDSLDLEAIPN